MAGLVFAQPINTLNLAWISTVRSDPATTKTLVWILPNVVFRLPQSKPRCRAGGLMEGGGAGRKGS